MKIKLIIILLCIFSFKLSASENMDLDLKIFKNLRCIICQGQSIAESNSDFSQTLKLVVRDQIEDGKSNKEIYNFLIEKYGEWIFYKPKVNQRNFLLWFIPYFVLIVGGLIIFNIVKRKNN